MRDFTIVGRLNKDPGELMQGAKTGRGYVDLQIVTNDFKQIHTHIVRMFDKPDGGGNATNAIKFLKQGSQVRLTGNMPTSRWQENTGTEKRPVMKTRYNQGLVAYTMEFLGDARNSGSEEAPAGDVVPDEVSDAVKTIAGLTKLADEEADAEADAEAEDNKSDDIPF